MSIALKYTAFKDAHIPLEHFRAEKRRFGGNRRTATIIAMAVAAVTLPLFFIYALVGPQGYRTWSLSEAGGSESQSAFLQEYASTPVPAQPANNFLTSTSE